MVLSDFGTFFSLVYVEYFFLLFSLYFGLVRGFVEQDIIILEVSLRFVRWFSRRLVQRNFGTHFGYFGHYFERIASACIWGWMNIHLSK